MSTLRTFFVIACLLAIWPAAPARAAGSCYQESGLPFYQQVVEIVEGRRDLELGCWVVRLRLRPSHAMVCGGNVCGTQSALREGIFWRQGSAHNENIKTVIPVEQGSCSDVSFCIVPNDVSETMLITFVALYEENWFIPPSVLRPRWSAGVIDLSSLDDTKSHCQDGEPRGAVCL